MRSRKAIASVAVLLGLGVIALATFGVDRSSIPPLPINRLGLTPQAAEETRQFVASLPGTAIVGADSDADNRSKRVMLEEALLPANGGQWPWHGPQETGDCAAFAYAYAIELDQANQITDGADIQFRPVDRPWCYYGGRFRDGKLKLSGAGSIPAWIGDFVGSDNGGVLFSDEPGVDAYSGKRSDDWGRNGPPAVVREIAKRLGVKVEDIQAVRSAQDACNQIVSRHPVVFGSMKWGTNSIKLVEGRNVARDTQDWPHAEVVTGYDGTLLNGQRLFRAMNSWGPDAHKPLSQMPGDRPGGYYFTWETMDGICHEGMCFAVSGTKGFRQREFVPDFSVIGAAAPAEAQTLQESQIMPPFSDDFQMPGYVLGVLLIAFGLFVLFVGNRGGRRIAGAVMLLALMTNLSARAQEFQPNFEALTVAAMPTAHYQASGPRTANDPVFVPDFSALTIAAQPSPINRAACDACTCPDCLCAKCDGQTCTALVAQASRRRAQGVQALLDASNATVETPPPKPAPKAPQEPAGVPVTVSGNWMYWQANGVNWDNSGTGVRDGYSYGDRWVYRNGRMLEIGPAKPALRPPAAFMPQSSAGHWVNQCQGGVCKLTWVPN